MILFISIFFVFAMYLSGRHSILSELVILWKADDSAITVKEGLRMASKGQKFKKVPLETKIKAVKEWLDEGKSSYYLGRKCGVSRKTVDTWIRIYKRDGGLDIRKKGRPKADGQIDYKERYEILKKYQDYLGEVDREKK